MIGDFLIGFINLLIDGLAFVCEGLLNILPTSPFQALDNSSVSEFIGGLNWIIPVSAILSIIQSWAVAIGLYYIVSIGLRWVKAIE